MRRTPSMTARIPLSVALAALASPVAAQPQERAAAAEQAPVEAVPPPVWSRCAEAIDWFVRIDTPNTERLLLELVMGGRLAEHSRTWIRDACAGAPPLERWLAEARDSGRPLLWWVTAVEGQHFILPHLLDRYVEVGILSDPDVAALVQRRFVAVKAPAGGTVAERYDLRTPRFLPPGFLVLDGSGRVLSAVDRWTVFQADTFAGHLRDVLRRAGVAAPSAELVEARAAWTELADLASGMRCIRAALLDGELDLAAEVTAALAERWPAEPDVLVLRARLERARQDAPAALAALDGAAEVGLAPALRHELDAERGLLAMRTGDLEAACAAFERALAAGGPRDAECGYHLGAVLWGSRREDAALEAWRTVRAGHPDSLWAARADAYLAIGADGLRGEGPLTRAMESLVWTRPVTDAHGVRWPRSLGDADDVLARAVSFLLFEQRSSGAWLGSRWGGDGGPAPDSAVGEGPGLFSNIHTAISALACTALLGAQGRGGVPPEVLDAALERGEPYLLDEGLVERGETTAWVYADGFRLLYFARRYPDPDARPEVVTRRMARWIDELLMQQDENGGSFRHYSYKSTFVTAMIVLALLEARDAGLDVPDEAFARAADVLAGARDGERGLFGYLLDAPALNRTPAGAACRQPLCTLALYRCGRTDREDVVRAVELFCEHFSRFVEPPRKSNFHMLELDGSAGYFFFHDFLAAAWAAGECGEEAPELRRRLLARLLELPEVDGTFLDSGFSYGKAYSTAMALLSLVELGA